MYCANTFQYLDSWNSYVRQNSWQSHSADCSSTSLYNGDVIYPIHLNCKDFNYNDRVLFIPKHGPVNLNTDEVLNIVISLDLTSNTFSEFPTLRRMMNLVTLNLSQNSLNTAKLSNMKELPSLKEIDLSHNTISYIQKLDYEYPLGKLENINLSDNYLEEIPDAIFESFSNLTNLDISYNIINTLSPFTFEGIKKLAYLNISHNKLSDINASLFRFSELLTLDLSSNKLKNINANDFNSLTKLTSLNLKSNIIVSIDKNTFLNLCILNSLDISDNELEILDKDTFKTIADLKNIMISKNKFKNLPKSLFKGKSIELFSIFENNLEGSIERGTFDGLQLVTELDLSNQRLDSIEDNAFYGLGQLVVLLLQNNDIKTLSSKCFNMLTYLKQLDLSYNKIINIEFEKENLGNLESLSIRNNYLTVIKHEHFQGLDSLQVLDLSDNKITRLESNSFKSLKNLISFEISNNPLNGNLEENTFEGLNSLPSLDISCTLLTTIQNGSFNGMAQLINLNISRSQIKTLQFNSFIHTGAMETLDLSHNKITEFNINNTQISNLNILYLNNNNIKALDSQNFGQMLHLTKIIISYNNLEQIETHAFKYQKDLRVLDVSYNPNLMFNVYLINNTNNLDGLHLSGIKTGMTFGDIENVPLSHITISNSSIADVKELKLNGLKHLDYLELSHNKISTVDFDCFSNISTLRTLDLSYNKITYIQPGALKDNTMLHSLNISHNYLTSITYGIFRGLIYLQTLDISYNNIDNLQNERFYEVRSLTVLIVDHNRIETINAEEFLGTSLSKLSIGDNPIPCNLLVSFQQKSLPFQITAIKLDENNSENVKGITCNKYKDIIPYNIPGVIPPVPNNDNIRPILINIRDILLNKLNSNDHEFTKSKDEEYLANITSQTAKINNNIQNQLLYLTNLTSKIANNNGTNILLERILKVMTMSSLKRPTTPAPITKNNATYDNLVNYINKLKQQLEDTIAFEKNNILNEVETKLSAVSSRDSMTEAVHEKLSAEADALEPKSIFTETCVGLILLILVCLVLYKFYKSGMFMRKRLSVSTRELPDAMDSVL